MKQKNLVERLHNERRRVTSARLASAKPKAKAAAKAKLDRPWGPRNFYPVPDGALSQQAASSLCPPGGHIWRNNYGGGWQCHMRPFKRLATLDRLVGHKEGALQCLRHVWADYLEKLHGLPLARCPIAGLMAGPTPSASQR